VRLAAVVSVRLEQSEEKSMASSDGPRRFGATAEVARGGVVLLVGIGGRLVVVCAAAAMDAKLRHVLVPRADDACARIREIAPRVIVVPGSMAREERSAIGSAAREMDAEIVDLPAVVAPPEVAHAVSRALAVAEARRADARGPSTHRSPSSPGF
jgi:hypothetical protein